MLINPYMASLQNIHSIKKLTIQKIVLSLLNHMIPSFKKFN